MKTTLQFALFIALLCTYESFAQVGIGTVQPHTSAILEVKSTTQGFVLPRLSNAQRGTINNPAEGLVIYNTDESCLNVFNSNSWVNLCGGGNSNNPNQTPDASDITNLNCSTMQITANIATVNTAFTSTISIPYVVATNNVAYAGGHEITPAVAGTTANNNFKLTLRPGNTGSTGVDTFFYDLTGTATTIGNVSFIIDFNGNPVGGCGVNITVTN
ncbi:MAG: hypothetical protein N4A45_12260 [Flavobacteriales bacterium]|jgi:hypothetical protein|nr:hypothetical protein [Flavobacteriales bacterium]